jgi:hypothetical protein
MLPMLFTLTDNREPQTVNRKGRFLTAFEMTGRAIGMIGNEGYDFVLF